MAEFRSNTVAPALKLIPVSVDRNGVKHPVSRLIIKNGLLPSSTSHQIEYSKFVVSDSFYRSKSYESMLITRHSSYLDKSYLKGKSTHYKQFVRSLFLDYRIFEVAKKCNMITLNHRVVKNELRTILMNNTAADVLSLPRVTGIYVDIMGLKGEGILESLATFIPSYNGCIFNGIWDYTFSTREPTQSQAFINQALNFNPKIRGPTIRQLIMTNEQVLSSHMFHRLIRSLKMKTRIKLIRMMNDLRLIYSNQALSISSVAQSTKCSQCQRLPRICMSRILLIPPCQGKEKLDTSVLVSFDTDWLISGLEPEEIRNFYTRFKFCIITDQSYALLNVGTKVFGYFNPDIFNSTLTYPSLFELEEFLCNCKELFPDIVLIHGTSLRTIEYYVNTIISMNFLYNQNFHMVNGNYIYNHRITRFITKYKSILG